VFFIRANDAKSVLFENNEKRVYYLNKSFGIIDVVIPPMTKETAHYHKEITEVIYVLSGSVKAILDNGEHVFNHGDVFVFSPKTGFHNLENNNDTYCHLLTFKFRDTEDNVNFYDKVEK